MILNTAARADTLRPGVRQRGTGKRRRAEGNDLCV